MATARISIREARGDDEAFLSEMLYEAGIWRPGSSHPSVDEFLSHPKIAVYISGWGRPGDEGLIAESATDRPIGAAWFRLFSREAHGFGFVDAKTPELTIAVGQEFRGRGAGSALLEALITRARERGHPAVSLSVEPDNPALRLYERAGFRVVDTGEALTMVRDLSQRAESEPERLRKGGGGAITA